MFVGFVFFGVEIGGAIAGLTLVAIIVAAVLDQDDGTIEIAAPGAGVPGGVLVVAIAAIEDPGTAGEVAAIADAAPSESGRAGLLVVSPARARLLDRWAGDLDRAGFESQRTLTISLATLAAAGHQAEGRVGDGDVVQATEDTLRTYAATAIVVVAPQGAAERQIRELDRRLEGQVHRVAAGNRDER
jgi:hypothetical protein